MTQTCVTCGGKYSTASVDGVRYFHACADTFPAIDRRDENVPSTNAKDAGSMKSPGKGVS